MSSFFQYRINEGMIALRTFKATNGNTLTAIDDTQAEAMISGGMIEISKAEAKAIAKAVAKEIAAAAKAAAMQGTNDADPALSNEEIENTNDDASEESEEESDESDSSEDKEPE